MNIPKPTKSTPRERFDLNQTITHSSRVGHYKPVLALDCIPGDYFEIDLLSLTRASAPLKNDAFTNFHENFDFVFIPFSQLWSPWNEFINESEEAFSTRSANTGVFSTADGSNSRLNFQQVIPTNVPYFDLKKLLDYLKLAFQGLLTPPDATIAPGSMNYYRAIDGILRLLDMLGYGAYYEYVYNEGTLPSSFAYKPNMFRLLAYQKAWFDYMRNTTYDAGNPMAFNVDWIASFNSAIPSTQNYEYPIPSNGSAPNYATFISNMQPFLLRTCQWHRDKFTSLYPQPQFGVVSSVDILQKDLFVTNVGTSNPNAASETVIRTETGNIPVGDSKKVVLGGYSVSNKNNDAAFSIPSAFSVYDLRYMKMLQHWKENKMRAGNKTSASALAKFGVKPRYLGDNYSDYVDGFDNLINISEVVSTSGTTDTSLGEIGGKAVGGSNHRVKFKSDDFGVLLCIYSVVPTLTYKATMIDKQNSMVEMGDFYNPFFIDQGFEPVNSYELDAFGLTPFTLGYAPRYSCYKTAVSKVHGEFIDGVFKSWVTPRKDLWNFVANGQMSKEWFYVVPSIVDNIFVGLDTAAYSPTFRYQVNDHFINNFTFNVKAVRNLSKLGLPSWT